MKLNARDLKVRLSDVDNEPAGQRLPPREKKSVYKQIVDFPGRVVKADTAYGRLRRYPNMSIQDACLNPVKNKRSDKLQQMYSLEMLTKQAPQKYIDDLRSDKSNHHVSRIWGNTPPTVSRHRKLLRSQDA